VSLSEWQRPCALLTRATVRGPVKRRGGNFNSFRPPSADERNLISDLTAAEFPGREEVVEQLEQYVVRPIDEDARPFEYRFAGRIVTSQVVEGRLGGLVAGDC
jgi:hypothetical protein